MTRERGVLRWPFARPEPLIEHFSRQREGSLEAALSSIQAASLEALFITYPNIGLSQVTLERDVRTYS